MTFLALLTQVPTFISFIIYYKKTTNQLFFTKAENVST